MAGTEARGLLEQHGPAPGTVILTQWPGEVLSLFEELIRSALRGTAYAPRVSALILEQLILRIAESSVSHGIAGGPAFETYLRCRQHIENRWGQISTLEQLARECEVDPAYVCRLFKRFDHQTPYQYLLRQKMTHAANRLTENGTTIKQVADELGFSDPFHFSRVFRKVMGLPPGEFARMYHRG
jgi:AraC-like DNA-binding protein